VVREAASGDVDGRYEVVGRLGRGAQGAVLRVIDRGRGDRCVLKAVEAIGEEDEAALVAEFRHLTRLTHPALVPVRDLGRVEHEGALPRGTVYVTADEVDGAPALSVAALEPGERARAIWTIAADVAAALAVVHGAGLVHHDVAPGNVIVVGDGADARAVLLDLGLCTVRGGGGDARGTPAYMAPEALAGRGDPRSDLWSLGATLHHLATGAAFFDRGGLAETARAIVTLEPPAAALPGGLAALVARLLARDPSRRPPSALALADELDAIAGALDRPVRRRPRPAVRAPAAAVALVGADAAIAAVEQALAVAPCLRVWGPPGASTAAVVAEAVRRRQLAAIAGAAALPAVVRGDLDTVADRLGVALVAADADERAAGRFAGAVAAAAAGRLVIAELAADPRADALARAAATAAGHVVVVETRATAPAPRPGVVAVEVGAASLTAIAALAAAELGRPVPVAWAESLHRASAGLPALAADIARVAAGRPDPLATLPEAIAPDAAAVADAFARRALAAPAAERALLAAVAAWDGRARTEAAAATAAALHADRDALVAAAGALVAAGTLARDGDQLLLAAPLAAAIAARLDDASRGALHATAAAWATFVGAPAAVRARHLLGAPPVAGSAPVLSEAAAAALARGRSGDALALGMAAIEVADDEADCARTALVVARAALVLGRYDQAEGALGLAATVSATAQRARLLLARIRQRRGDLDGAEALLAELAVTGDDEAVGAHARLLVARARYADAARIAGPVDRGRDRATSDAGHALRLEAAGLAALYQGDVDGAERAFAGLEAGAGDPASLGRALALRGMAAQQRSDLVSASALFARSSAALRDGGDVHAAAVADLNAGTALSERGRFAEALPVLAAAAADLAEVGAVAERAAAEFNRGNALLGLGQLDAARAAGEVALEHAARHGLPHIEVFAGLLLGDVARRAGDRASAAAHYRIAERLARAGGAPHALLSTLLPRAELAAVDDPAAADALLDEAASIAASSDDRDRLALARGRVLLATGDRDDAVADALIEAARRAVRDDRVELAFRLTAVAAQLGRADRAVAQRRAADAAQLHARLAAAAAPAWTLALADDLDGAELADLLAPAAAPPPSPPPGAEVPRLRRLLALSRRLNGEGSLDRLLDDVIDAAIELTAAERGFLLLRGGREAAADELAVMVARGFADGDLDGSGSSFSRSIAEKAAQSGEPVITLDAGRDERFGAAASVAAFRLRSVMAVPLRRKGQVAGCLYVDHRLRGGAFDDDAAALLLDLADIAAVAIDNARLAADLRRQADEIDALNRRLAADIADRDAELVAVRARLGRGRDALAGAYPSIIGRSPAVVAMLERVERAARVALPVVIVGESGTGKELIARALHEHGPRRDRPFVAVNCSAMPEPLLESELFGHVRGAFTGADRDRRGLFEVADGGTLFLDEVADTGPAMQAKLLRVLQDGTFRRVGDERVRRADVRVVAATQRPLAELAAAGRFRDDLRFRLEVIAIEAPPLRARPGDIPLLIEHILARVAGERPPRLTRGALRALELHAWPGNIRELENALARAVALGGEVIDVDDLPEGVARARASRPAALPDQLTLKPAIAALERSYLDAALARANGNQTVAARLLGLSRFGLQKKLRRLSGDDSDDET
jgi:serine/threonine-protein kinase PknK